MLKKFWREIQELIPNRANNSIKLFHENAQILPEKVTGSVFDLHKRLAIRGTKPSSTLMILSSIMLSPNQSIYTTALYQDALNKVMTGVAPTNLP